MIDFGDRQDGQYILDAADSCLINCIANVLFLADKSLTHDMSDSFNRWSLYFVSLLRALFDSLEM